MPNRRLTLFAAAVGLFLTGSSGAEEPAWTPLFDGQTLGGWKQVIEPSPKGRKPDSERGHATFRVEDGVIVGHAEKCSMHSYLCTEEEYNDFELEFEVFVGWPETKTGACNSGIQIRSKWEPELESHRLNGLQVDIDARPGFAGALFVEGQTLRKLAAIPHPKDDPNPHTYFKANEWNTMRIRAVGPRIQTWVNGEPVADKELPELYQAQPRGFIGLQVHEIGNAKPAEIRWRNIKIREWKETP